MARLSLRKIHDAAGPLVVPLAHDALSARLIERAGFPAFNIGGSSLLAARYGIPDVGLAGMGEMAMAIADIVQSVSIPCLADADDGYGDVKSVVHTVETYHRIGAGGVLIEDQVRGNKRPGDQGAGSVVSVEVIEQKLRAAIERRPDPDFVVIGRTDAAGTEGLEAALRRAERFLKLGVDGVFIAGLKTTADYERAGSAFKGQWNMAVMPEGRIWHTPGELYAMGFSQIVYTNSLILRVTGVLEQTLEGIGALAAGKVRTLSGADTLPVASFDEAVQLRRWNEIEASAGQAK